MKPFPRIQEALEKLKAEWQQKYNPMVFEFSLEENPSQEILIQGKVLSRKQLQQILSCLPLEEKISVQIEVLSETSSTSLVEAHRVGNVLESPGGRMISQILPEEGPCRLLNHPEVQGYLLVQLPDKTLGWVEKACLLESEKSLRPLWDYPFQDRLNFIHSSQKEELLMTGKAFLGVPYLWGGRTRGGLDCSALIQAIFRDALGILLPRHSGDQRKIGLRISSKEMKSGDLYFARQIEKNILHVALVTGPNQVLHACLDKGVVVEEELSKFQERYQCIGIRRLIDGCW